MKKMTKLFSHLPSSCNKYHFWHAKIACAAKLGQRIGRLSVTLFDYNFTSSEQVTQIKNNI